MLPRPWRTWAMRRNHKRDEDTENPRHTISPSFSCRLIHEYMPIRRLGQDDYDEYLSLIREFRDTQFSESEFRETLGSLPDTHHIWVYAENDRLLGTITVLYERKFIFNRCWFAHIEDVCVRTDARHKRIGSQLLNHVVDDATRRGCMKATLVCNESVAPFYLSNSFEKRGVQCSRLLRSV